MSLYWFDSYFSPSYWLSGTRVPSREFQRCIPKTKPAKFGLLVVVSSRDGLVNTLEGD